MSTRLFNGSTLTFGGSAVGKLAGMAFRIGGNWNEVTAPEDLNKLYELSSQDDFSLQLRFKGCHALTNRAKGTMAIAFSNGFTATCPGTWQVGVFDFSGDQDAPWQSTAEGRPTVPDA